MLYDTHCHLNLPDFLNETPEQMLEECVRLGIWMNNVGTTYATSVEAVNFARRNEQGVYAVVGSHPENFLPAAGEYAESLDPNFDIDKFRELALDPKVVGIGECGLDYYRLPEGIDRAHALELQAPPFIAQIRLAKELGKALVIHCRPGMDSVDAYEDCLEILRSEKPEKFEIHSFTGDWEICQKFLELGAYIALNGIITFEKKGILAEVATEIPIEKLILETDAPFLAPMPFRGKKNRPQYIVHTAEFIASLRGISLEEIASMTTENAKHLFDHQR